MSTIMQADQLAVSGHSNVEQTHLFAFEPASYYPSDFAMEDYNGWESQSMDSSYPTSHPSTNQYANGLQQVVDGVMTYSNTGHAFTTYASASVYHDPATSILYPPASWNTSLTDPYVGHAQLPSQPMSLGPQPNTPAYQVEDMCRTSYSTLIPDPQAADNASATANLTIKSEEPTVVLSFTPRISTGETILIGDLTGQDAFCNVGGYAGMDIQAQAAGQVPNLLNFDTNDFACATPVNYAYPHQQHPGQFVYVPSNAPIFGQTYQAAPTYQYTQGHVTNGSQPYVPPINTTLPFNFNYSSGHTSPVPTLTPDSTISSICESLATPLDTPGAIPNISWIGRGFDYLRHLQKSQTAPLANQSRLPLVPASNVPYVPRKALAVSPQGAPVSIRKTKSLPKAKTQANQQRSNTAQPTQYTFQDMSVMFYYPDESDGASSRPTYSPHNEAYSANPPAPKTKASRKRPRTTTAATERTRPAPPSPERVLELTDVLRVKRGRGRPANPKPGEKKRSYYYRCPNAAECGNKGFTTCRGWWRHAREAQGARPGCQTKELYDISETAMQYERELQRKIDQERREEERRRVEAEVKATEMEVAGK